MKLKKHILFIIISGGLILSACQKENIDIFLPDNGQFGGADTNWVIDIDPSMPVSLLKADLAISIHTDSIEINNTATELNSSSGLHCTFQANSLTDFNNVPVSGKITVQSILMQKKGDMIRLNRPSISNGYIVSSSGMLYINLKKDNSSVKLASQSKLNIQYRDNLNMPLLKLFYGTDTTVPGVFNWYMNNDSANNIIQINEGYKVNTNQLGWINTGYILENNPLQRVGVNINLAKHFTNTNTVAWLVFKNHRSVVSLKGDAVIRKFSCDGIPSDKEATIIVISRQVDDYYMGTEDINTSTAGGTSLSVTVTPVKTSLDALLQYLNSL